MPHAFNEQAYTDFLDAIINGATVKKACAQVGLPWRSVSYWIAMDDERGARYAHARTLSAQYWADAAVVAVRQAKSKDDAPLARVRSEVYRWRASVANPKEYGNNVNVQAQVQHVVSGIMALPDEDTPSLPSTTVTARLSQPIPNALPDAQPIDTAEVESIDASDEGGGGDPVGGGPGSGVGM